MTAIHRNTDSRVCGATTTATGQGSVYANGLLVSVNGDPNTHGSGALNASTNEVYAEGIMVVEVGDTAAADNLCPVPGGSHCAPSSSSGSGSVYVGS